jgi:TetR/AcrR family transcriptional regulator
MGNEHTQCRMSAADRQKQLLEVAMSAFSRRGFKGTTTKEIAAAAGVAEAIIFQHFPSKEALYSAVLERHLETGDEEKWVAEINGCMERNDDEGLFLSFMRRILHAYRHDPLLERVILFAALEGHQQGLARMQAQFAPVFERSMEYISRRQSEGVFIDCSPHAIMVCLGGIAHQYGLITQIFRAPMPELSDEEIARQFTRILLRGIKKEAPAETVIGDAKTPSKKSKRKANK